jgi:hypothetical protein
MSGEVKIYNLIDSGRVTECAQGFFGDFSYLGEYWLVGWPELSCWFMIAVMDNVLQKV